MASLQEMLRKLGRTPMAVDGEEFMANGRPSYGMGARRLMPSRVGVGTQSSGMTTGGGIGSALMMSGNAVPGMAMGGVQQQPRQPAVNAFETAKATATRMQQSGQRAPTVMQTPDGNTRVIGSGAVTLKPNKEQFANRAAFSAALDARRGNVASRGMARGQARDERMQFASDAQTMGRGPALIRAFERQGIAPERAAAMMQGNMQFLSEDNRQRRAVDEVSARTALDKRREDREDAAQKFMQDYSAKQPTPEESAIMEGIANDPTLTWDEKREQIQSIRNPGGTPSAGGPPGIPSGAVPTQSGAMIRPAQAAQLQALAANYSGNPAAVGQQIVDALRKQPGLTDADRLKELRQLTGNRFATLEDPSGGVAQSTFSQQRRERSMGGGNGFSWAR